MPGQFAASCGTPGPTTQPGARPTPPGQHRHATPQPRRPASDTGGPLGGWPPPGARCAARATRDRLPGRRAPHRTAPARRCHASARRQGGPCGRWVRTPEPTQPTIMPGPHTRPAGAGQDARPRNRPDREVLYARQPIPRQAEDSTESAIYRRVGLDRITPRDGGCPRRADSGVVPDRAGAGNGRRPGPAVPASAQPWCQTRSRPTAMSAVPDPPEVAVRPARR